MLSTYTKIVISGWPAIFELINKYTRVLLSKQQETLSTKTAIPLLSEAQVREVMMDKQNSFIRYSIATRAKMLLASSQVNEQLNLAKQQAMQIEDSIQTLQRLFEQTKNQNLSVDFHNLEVCQKDIKKIINDLEKKQLFFTRITDKLDELTYKQDKEWEAFRDKWAKKLTLALEKSGLPLTELEKNEIERQKTMAELVDRMKELGLTLPKGINV